MFKRMKKVYDVEFHEVSSDWAWCKEEGYYKINKNENRISLVKKFQSNIATNLSMLKLTDKFNVFWDNNLGIVIPVGKRTVQRRNIIGTISKIGKNKYFFLLRRMNLYA